MQYSSARQVQGRSFSRNTLPPHPWQAFGSCQTCTSATHGSGTPAPGLGSHAPDAPGRSYRSLSALLARCHRAGGVRHDRHCSSHRALLLGLMRIGCLALVLSTSLNAFAQRTPLYGVLENETLLNCEDLYWHGENREANGESRAATQCYQEMVQQISLPPQIRAEAMWALGDIQTANNLFRSAVEQEPENALIRLRWGELFLHTYQNQEALNLFNEALAIDADNAWAHLGAMLALEGNEPEVSNQHLTAVMDSPGAAAGAKLRSLLQVLRGRMERDDLEEAATLLEQARTLAEEENLPTLEVNAYTAALAFLRHEDYLPHVEAALDESPAYGDAWAIPAYFATITRRYNEAGEFYENAVAVQADHWRAHVELGQNYLRINQVEPAIEHIRLSYDGDPFNPMTVNLLRLLDTFTEEFVLVNYPDPPQGPLPELSLRLHQDERDVLKDYAHELAMDSIKRYTERYRFSPKEPIVIEIYPNHEDFVVRSIGMPGVGILGVTFGYLFAMDSPSGHPQESYHWGTTLWHEMAHVFTVEASDHLVPRWYSEGISVYEEWRSGPIPGRKIPLDVLQAMAEDKFLPISELDDGFMRPSYEGQVIVSYMQSGLVFEYIDDTFGFEPIVDMLYLFKDAISPAEAIEQVLNISVEEFDQGFADYIEAEFGDFLPHMKDFVSHTQNSFKALQEGRLMEAVQAAESAIFIYPDYAEVDSPYVVLARAYNQAGDKEQAFQALRSFREIGGWAPSALMALADNYLERDMPEQAAEVLMDINWADPFDEELHRKLGDTYMDLQRPAEALREYTVLLALEPLDKAAAHYRLARAYHALGDMEAGMDALMTALDIAPQYRPAQRLLLEMSE